MLEADNLHNMLQGSYWLGKMRLTFLNSDFNYKNPTIRRNRV